MQPDSRTYPPTYADGTVYFASHNSSLYAVDTDNGQLAWQIEQNTSPSTSPTVRDGLLIYAGTTNAIALDVASGQKQWDFEPPGTLGSLDGAFDDDTELVYFGASNHSGTSISVENPYDRVYALNRSSGEQAWTTTLSSSRNKHLPPRDISAAGGQVFATVGDHDSYLISFDANDGEELWRNSIGQYPDKPVVGENTVYQNSGADILAFDITSGQLKWRADGDDTPAIADTTVYGTYIGNLHAYDATDGQVRWKAKVSGNVVGTPLVDDNVVYVSGETQRGNDRLYAFDASTGCRRGYFEYPDRLPPRPAIGGGLVFTGCWGENEQFKSISQFD